MNPKDTSFTKIMEDMIMKENSFFGKLFEKVGTMLNKAFRSIDLVNDKNILIIDEVDVFFD